MNDSTTTTTTVDNSATTVNNEASNDVSLIEDGCRTDTRCDVQRQTTTTTVWGSVDEKENLSPNVSFGAPTR